MSHSAEAREGVEAGRELVPLDHIVQEKIGMENIVSMQPVPGM